MITTDKWLPIGSVVHVDGVNRLLMIAGTMQMDQGTGRLWDYMGYPYPEGNMNPDQNLMFNKESVDGVYFLGYQPLEGLNFLEMLEQNEEEFRKRQAEADRQAGVMAEPVADGDQ